MSSIKGYIQGKPYCDFDYDKNNSNDEENDEYSDNNDTDIYFVILTIIDENNNKYKIKGKTTVIPKEYDDVYICNYEIFNESFNNKIEKVYWKKNGLISIKLSSNKDIIYKILCEMNIKSYNDNTIKEISEKYGEKIWYMDYVEVKDKLINKYFIDAITTYINEHVKNNRMSKYILDYLICEYNINITAKEYTKIESEINICQIKFPFEKERMENLILNLIHKIDQDKILDLCDKFNLSIRIKNKIWLFYSITGKIKKGSVCIKEEKIKNDVNLKDIQDIDELITELVNDEYIVRYNEYLYNVNQYNYEINISKFLERYIHNINNNINKYDIKNIRYKTTSIKTNDKQIEGLLNFLNNPISIVTGGPGYGKTTILRLLFENLKWLDIYPSVMIVGPTGKVVSKIKDDLEYLKDINTIDTLTIHKLIFSAKVKNKDIMEKLQKCKYLVIDELSMVSNKCFYDFLQLLDKENITAQILFIGDTNQLLAIDSGNILSNLLRSYCIPCIELEENMRAKDYPKLVEAIEKIKKGEIPENSENFKIIETGDLYIKNKLIDTIAELMNKKINFKNIGILTSKGKTIDNLTDDVRNYVFKYDKKENINKKIQKDEHEIGDYIYIKKNIYVGKADVYDNYKNYYKKHFKIDKNDTNTFIPTAIYSKFDLFNGMFGIINDIEFINNKKYYCVDFDYKKEKVNKEENKEENNQDQKIAKFESVFFNNKYINKMAYINTVHKYQGSENDYIILILPSNDDYLKRNLIYTAVSRAKKQCIVIGDRDVFEKCIKSNEIRNSRLYEMIKSIIKPEDNQNMDEDNNNEKIGIKTKGKNNIGCRSRCEGIWTYMIEYLNWKNEYEPYDFNGYTPDILIKKSNCKNIKNLLMEIKSDKDESEFNDYYDKYLKCSKEKDSLLIVNNGFTEENNELCGLHIKLGKIYFFYKDIKRCSDFILYKDNNDEWTHAYIYKERVYNKINKTCLLEDRIKSFKKNNYTNKEDIIEIKSVWNSFKNKAQWNPIKKS
jgi:hypothetical protein